MYFIYYSYYTLKYYINAICISVLKTSIEKLQISFVYINRLLTLKLEQLECKAFLTFIVHANYVLYMRRRYLIDFI